MTKYRIKEVLNYGGFFGGDTVNAICEPYAGGREEDVTIDEGVFDNLKDRYKVLNGFVVELEREGERVTRARILAAPTRDQLKEVIDADTPSERAHRYRVFAYRCTAENLWVRGEPEELGGGRYRCVLCGEEFSS
ncbi:MAG: hypothetical protein H0T73_05500 [Ardenticatenales bacterium]|nr:hypothetical protein [Ardenticatenales bacterium]